MTEATPKKKKRFVVQFGQQRGWIYRTLRQALIHAEGAAKQYPIATITEYDGPPPGRVIWRKGFAA